MGKFPCLKPSLLYYPLLSLFLISIISCSTFDQSTTAPAHTEVQPSSAFGKELNSIDEKQKNIVPILNQLENKSEINILRKELKGREEEIIFLQEELTQITRLKKIVDTKNKKITQLNSELLQIKNLHNTELREIPEPNTIENLKEREELLDRREIEIHAISGKLANKFSSLKRNQSQVIIELAKRKESLDQREKEIELKERRLMFKEDIKNRTLAKERSIAEKNNKKSLRMSTLFQKLPLNNFKKYNEKIVLDVENKLLWTRANFYQKEGAYPETARECREWADQMSRERYGGIKNWRVPNKMELSQLTYPYRSVVGGESENFDYWGIGESGVDKLILFKFKHRDDEKTNSTKINANCRLVSNLANFK